jgi:hypothetical protein
MCAYDLRLRRIDLDKMTFTSGNNTLVAGGQLGAGIGSIKVLQMQFTSPSATTITPYSNTTRIGETIGPLTAGATVTAQNEGQSWQETLPGQSLIWNLSTASALSGSIWYSLA